MQKTILNQEQVSTLVSDNKYCVEDASRFISRCIDGRYKNNAALPALAFPGADAGDLALFFATANSYGFEINRKKTRAAFLDVIGGIQNFQFHTDAHAKEGIVLAGCGHFKQADLDASAYRLTDEDLVFIKETCDAAKKAGAVETVLEGEHGEGAVLLISGDYSVLPQADLKIGARTVHVQVFEYHSTLVDARHRIIAKKLLENQAVKLLDGCDEEYLYEAFSEMSENHLMETARRLAKDLPIFGVKFTKNGAFEIEEMGKV